MQLTHVGSYNYQRSVQSLAAMEAYRNQQLQPAATEEAPVVELKEAS